MSEFSLYIHYPYCISKCPYCDFNSYKFEKIAVSEEFLNAYLIELENYYKLIPNKCIKTIFFGGGTPSLMSIKFFSKIMEKINDLWGISDNIEISMEANPTTVEMNKFAEFHKIGINRLSIGIQSLNDNVLRFFKRTHNKENGIKAIKIAQNIFNDKYSIDLIYARPQQKLKDWVNELKEAINLSPYHISLYQLIIAEGTKFYDNNVETMIDTKASRFYNITNNILEENDLHIYEVSNYAKKGYECQHNLTYWNSGEWLGIGAGAHSRICFSEEFVDNYKIRYDIENENIPEKWMKNIHNRGFGYSIKNPIPKNEFIEEIFLMGLRLKNGINIDNLQNYIKVENVKDLVNNKYLDILQKNNIIEINDKNLRIKMKYFNILDSIIEKII